MTIQEKHRRPAAMSPVQVSAEVEIPATRETVFAYLADLRNNPDWNWAVKSTESVDGNRPRRGARYRQHRVGAQRPYVLEITGYQPPEVVEVAGRIDEGEVRYHYRLSPSGADRTTVVATVQLRPEGEMTGSRLYSARLEMAVSANLDALRQAAGRMTEISSNRGG